MLGSYVVVTLYVLKKHDLALKCSTSFPIYCMHASTDKPQAD